MIACDWCDNQIADPPQTVYATSRPQPIYCNDTCELAEKYHTRRTRKDRDLWWSHDCPDCERPMFTPREKDGWWCPECDHSKPIDKTGLEYLKDKGIGSRRLTEFDRKCPNPECDSYIWLFDGALQCHDCDVYIMQYGREWWAMIEEEYPPQYSTYNTRKDTEQSQL